MNDAKILYLPGGYPPPMPWWYVAWCRVVDEHIGIWRIDRTRRLGRHQGEQIRTGLSRWRPLP